MLRLHSIGRTTEWSKGGLRPELRSKTIRKISHERGVINKITLAGSAEYGKRLLDFAAADIQEERGKKALGHVRDLLLKKESLQDMVLLWNSEIDLITKKIAAIEAGRFKFEKDGKLIFEDKELNI